MKHTHTKIEILYIHSTT